MKFRIKGTTEVLVPRMTDEGAIVLVPEGNQMHYIDDYFHDDRPVPGLEMSADGIVWFTIAGSEDASMQIIRPDDWDKA